jgi:hypothetical protein
MGVPASFESFSGVVPRDVRSAKLSCDIIRPNSHRNAPRRVDCIVGTRGEELPKPGNRLALRISQSRKEAIERQDPQPSGRVPLETRNQTGQSTQAADDEIVAEEVLRLVELLPPDIRMTLQERPDVPQVTHDAVRQSKRIPAGPTSNSSGAPSWRHTEKLPSSPDFTSQVWKHQG